MWQDYAGIIPGTAATVMGLVTLMSREMPRWKRVVVLVLTVIAIGATGFSQWWALYEKKIQEAKRTEILETLGGFIAEGQSFMNQIEFAPKEPVPIDKINAWAEKTEDFLMTLGLSYAARFSSGAGLETSLSPTGADAEHADTWRSIRVYLTRLHEFSAEFAGQIPRAQSEKLF
jgi:hypothetical protein